MPPIDFGEELKEVFENKPIDTTQREIEKKLEEIEIKKFELQNLLEPKKTAEERFQELSDSIKQFNQKPKIKNISPKINDFIANVEAFYNEVQPFFYDKSQIFWFWQPDQFKWEIVDEIDLMNSLDDACRFYGGTIDPKIKAKYIESFKRIGRTKIPKNPSKNWIQFKNKIFDIETKLIFDATSKYFFCNPIPFEIGETSETPIIDKLFTDWVGEKDKVTLYELIAYSCYIDYPIQLVFCLAGIGRNGKSRFQALTCKFIGNENVCSTELDTLLNSRFETGKLYKKMICSLGETNFGVMNKTSLLKKLTGQDLIGFEYKNKKPFDDYNYAKMIISSNSLPTSEDTSEGFYRRWLIIDFPNKFEEGVDILSIIPDIEYKNLARKVTEILPSLISKGKFTHQGTPEQRKNKYIMASNPLMFFIDEYCVKSSNGFVRYGELYTHYVHYLTKNNRRNIGKKEFSKVLAAEGYEIRRNSEKIGELYVNDTFVYGIRLNYDKMSNVNYMNTLSTISPIRENQLEVSSYSSHESKTEEPIYENNLNPNITQTPPTYFPCQVCNAIGTYTKEYKGKPVCDLCLEYFKS